jgi:hypothetical protein
MMRYSPVRGPLQPSIWSTKVPLNFLAHFLSMRVFDEAGGTQWNSLIVEPSYKWKRLFQTLYNLITQNPTCGTARQSEYRACHAGRRQRRTRSVGVWTARTGPDWGPHLTANNKVVKGQDHVTSQEHWTQLGCSHFWESPISRKEAWGPGSRRGAQPDCLAARTAAPLVRCRSAKSSLPVLAAGTVRSKSQVLTPALSFHLLYPASGSTSAVQ